MAEITDTLSEPFSESSSALPSWFSPSVIGIDGRPYLIDTKSGGYGRQGIDVVQQRNTSDNRDLLLLPQDVWRQQTQSWHQGAGQFNVDRDDTLPYRYHDSFGVNPWERWEISLLNKTLLAAGGPTGVDPIFLAVHNGYTVAGSGSKLYWWNDLAAAPTEVTVGTGTIVSMVYDGDSVIALNDDGEIYYASGASASATSISSLSASVGATFIAYVKDYLLVGVGNKLLNITGPTPVEVYTSPVAGFRWLGACEGNTEIYLLGGSNDKWLVHRVGIKSDGTGLDPCVVAASLPDGEIGYSIGSYLGYVFVGTGKGVRMGVLTSDTYVTLGNLTLGALIPTASPVYGFEGQDRFVWFTNSSVPSLYSSVSVLNKEFFPDAPRCGLSRMDLSVFTVTENTPAYASDIVAMDATGKTVQSVVTYNDKRVFSVNGAGVYYETAHFMEAGWLTQGIVSFSVEDVKTGLYAQGKWLPLDGEIDFDVAYDSTGYVSLATFTTQNSIRSHNVTLNGTQFSRINMRYVLKQADPTATDCPHLTRSEIRAIPAKGKASRWVLPVMNYDEIEIDGVAANRDVLGECDTLMNLYESGRLFTLQESGRSYQVSAKNFQWKPEKLSMNGRGWQGMFILIVEEII